MSYSNQINNNNNELNTILSEISALMTIDEKIGVHNQDSNAHESIQEDINTHVSNKSNPHNVKLTQLGVTATAAELNKMDGVTATTTELNYVDGVKSNIQTQLDGKAASSHEHAAADIISGTLSSDRLPTVPITKGGTGATSASAVRTNLDVYSKSEVDSALAEFDSGVGAAGTGTNAEIFNNYTNNIASGDYSHAEGNKTTTSSYYSHAEGYSTKVTSDLTTKVAYIVWPEENNKLGISAHAEGTGGVAIGNASHVEGLDTKTEGLASHAEGWLTTASGDYSHVEGYQTITNGNCQHVQGKYNVSDTTSAHIVGNGNHSARSNAHILDWNGNAWFAGDVYVGSTSGTNKDEGSVKLVTEDEIIGKSVEGLTLTISSDGTTATAGDGAEILNDYRDRNYTTSNGTNVIHGNVSTGNYSLAIGVGTTATHDAAFTSGVRTSATGQCAVAEGFETTAGSHMAHAEGWGTTALGYAAHAEGKSNDIGVKGVAYGVGSHVEGVDNVAGLSSYAVSDVVAAHAEGYNTTASGQYSHAEGEGTTASGSWAHAEGYNTTASAAYAHAEGKGTTAAVCCHAEGLDTKAYGNNSHAAGHSTTAGSNQYVIGHYNGSGTTGSSSGTTGDAFIIGKGSSSSGTNAFRVTYAGKTFAVSTGITSGADYAEYFEWIDGNPNNEDRRGYFVTLDGEQIKIAEPNDYILGIISGMPAILGNGDENWRGRYIYDEFGAFITEEFEYEEEIFDIESGEKTTVTKTGTRYKENPDYDPSLPYIQREDRPEWDAVGMIGVLSVRDDGTCRVNGFCKVAEGGIATASENGYRVIKRINENIIKVVFK